jgi:hypothetical protein
MSEYRYVLLQFNFCSKPLNKDNISRINVDIEDRFTLKEALSSAIDTYNQNNQRKIINETALYKIRLSKKSGVPDNDLPGNIMIN